MFIFLEKKLLLITKKKKKISKMIPKTVPIAGITKPNFTYSSRLRKVEKNSCNSVSLSFSL